MVETTQDQKRLKHLTTTLLSAGLATVALSGCTSGGAAQVEPTEAASPMDYEGTWISSGSWDLSGPFATDRTLGDIVIDVVIQQTVEQSSVPGPLRDEAEEALAGLIHDHASDFIDKQLPDDLGPDGDAIARLGQVFAQVDVTTELTFADGDATERLLDLHVHHGDAHIKVPLQVITGQGSDPLMVAADIDVSALGDTLHLDTHTFEIHLGRLVQWLVEDVLAVNTEPIHTGVARALDCDALVSGITDKALLSSLEVAGRSFEFKPRLLTAGCEAARGQLTEMVIGLTHKDTGVELGGDAKLVDLDGDGVADRISSVTGYGGALTSVPGPLDPSVAVTFTATRVSD